LIASTLGTGIDGTVLQAWSGATADVANEQDNVFGSSAIDMTHLFKLYAAGVAGNDITVSKGDDGTTNTLSVFYVQIT
jgi:hypothetical protein